MFFYMRRNIWIYLIILVLVMFGNDYVTVNAAESIVCVERTSQNNQAILFLRGADLSKEALEQFSVYIGENPCDDVGFSYISDEKIAIQTHILIDNSYSIPENIRSLIGDTLNDIVAARMQGEQFSVSVFDESVHELVPMTDDYVSLKNAFQNIQYQDQETYLTDALYDYCNNLNTEDKSAFTRIIVVSDGVDNKAIGYTKEELIRFFNENNIPVYAVGIYNAKQSNSIGRNLIALQNEIERRKRILDKYGEENILKYQDKYYEGIYKEPFPFLFVIIDEFAEFKVQFPDFMTVVESLFQTGRSLGIYIILMAQNPSGVISDKMNANVNFRWCLKVANVADSNEMLTHPDAARLTNPGRAFVRVGNDMIYELVQSYYSGATYNPEKEDKGNEELDVFVVKENGERISYLEQEKKKKGGKKEINAVVEYITEFANTHRYEKARQVWMPRMAYEIVLDTVLESWHMYQSVTLA